MGRGVFFNLNTEGYQILSGKVGHMVKPPSEHFQFSQKWRKSYFHQIQPTDSSAPGAARVPPALAWVHVYTDCTVHAASPYQPTSNYHVATRCVLRQCCAQTSLWQNAGENFLNICPEGLDVWILDAQCLLAMKLQAKSAQQTLININIY